MNKGTFQINLDTKVLELLRYKVNDGLNINFNKFHSKKNKEYRSWDKICAIMDRLDDTVGYINMLKLNTGNHDRSAFDFFDFMNNASVIVDCVKELAIIYDVPDDTIENSTDIFNQIGKDGKGTDDRYFAYLRSLCSVHPVETSRHKRYQDNDYECSPFVTWNNRGTWINDDCDIYAVVYTNKDEDNFKRVRIFIPQIFNYVKKWLEFVAEIINSIDEYKNKFIIDLKNRPIKKEKEFDSYLNYLKNLKAEQTERSGLENWYDLDPIINLFEVKISNKKNQVKMNLYLNALKYAISFEHSSIQNMSQVGFENNGLKHCEKNIETTLYYELYSPYSGSVEQKSFSYNLEKIQFLSYDSEETDKKWAYKKLKEALPFLEKYVSFKDAKSDFEHYSLVQLALYLDCLENNCLINKNIPFDLMYRERLLPSK
ncbi:hypothetical protein [Oceanobacillus kimchii]|uniref:Uncharacterized protein n=1 Tax=Oceanobacillus kimchii TaxID=746691 RepID=A0ABQ5TPX6_9BACI|nr:hypothetical protein [Oceanobacillus kimchii]GLO68476.1 hypothetical protein MACH08_42600 [Oceanobacillus kimchii]